MRRYVAVLHYRVAGTDSCLHGGVNMASDDSPARYLTTAEAAEYLRYSRADAFLRAWRQRGLPLFRRPGGHYLIASEDLERFVCRIGSRAHMGQHVWRRPGREPSGGGGAAAQGAY